MKKKKKIYLAVPYKSCKRLSFIASNKIAGDLIKKGHVVFAPICHSHPIDPTGSRGISHEQWLKVDKEFLNFCDEVIVVILGDKGIQRIKNSKGVQQEIKWAREQNKDVKFIKYNS